MQGKQCDLDIDLSRGEDVEENNGSCHPTIPSVSLQDFLNLKFGVRTLIHFLLIPQLEPQSAFLRPSQLERECPPLLLVWQRRESTQMHPVMHIYCIPLSTLWGQRAANRSWCEGWTFWTSKLVCDSPVILMVLHFDKAFFEKHKIDDKTLLKRLNEDRSVSTSVIKSHVQRMCHTKDWSGKCDQHVTTKASRRRL